MSKGVVEWRKGCESFYQAAAHCHLPLALWEADKIKCHGEVGKGIGSELRASITLQQL